MKILFLDIDGVLIPSRAYHLWNQTKPICTTFDPCVVGMLNTLADRHDVKFVLHTSWCRTSMEMIARACDNPDVDSVHQHCIDQGLKRQYFHDHPECTYRLSGCRWQAVSDWLYEHGDDVTDYWIIDDEDCPGDWAVFKDRHIHTDFDTGLSYDQFYNLNCTLKG